MQTKPMKYLNYNEENRIFIVPINFTQLDNGNTPFWEAEFLDNSRIIYRMILKGYINNLNFVKNSSWKAKINFSDLDIRLNEKFNLLWGELNSKLSQELSFKKINYAFDVTKDFHWDIESRSDVLINTKSLFQIVFSIQIFQQDDSPLACNNEEEALSLFHSLVNQIPYEYVDRFKNILNDGKSCQLNKLLIESINSAKVQNFAYEEKKEASFSSVLSSFKKNNEHVDVEKEGKVLSSELINYGMS